MLIKIGTIIKKLRLENDITQDMLANAIGITPQAISRWESEVAYPDIELLPQIADYFSVSIDELIGYKLSEKEKALESLREELHRVDEVGTVDEKIAVARNAVAQFPGEHSFKSFLALYLLWKWQEDDKNPSIYKEIELLCNTVIDNSKDGETVSFAINTLKGLYAESGETGKAYKIVNKLQPMSCCRENALADGIGDGKVDIYTQDSITKHIDDVCMQIQGLVLDDELSNDSSTWDKKIEMLYTAINIYKLVYGQNLMDKHASISRYYYLISTYLLAQGKTEETFECLEKMVYHSKKYDKSYESDRGKYYSSALTDKIKYVDDRKYVHNCSYYMLDDLDSNCFDGIRENEKFKALYTMCKESAK